MEYVDVAWATSSTAPRDRIAPSPTAKRLPSFINFASARRSAAPGRRKKLMLRLVVTASGAEPDCGEHRDVHGEVGERHHGGPRYGAARTNEILPVRLANLCAAVPNLLDGEAAAGLEHLGKLVAQETLQLAVRKRRLAASLGRVHGVSPEFHFQLSKEHCVGKVMGLHQPMSVRWRIFRATRASSSAILQRCGRRRVALAARTPGACPAQAGKTAGRVDGNAAGLHRANAGQMKKDEI